MPSNLCKVWLWRSVGALATTISLVLFFPFLSACAYLKPLPATVEQQVQDATNYELDGIIVYVDSNSHKDKTYAAGINSRENNTPMKGNTLFKIASISKLYVAAAGAMLVQEGKLDLNKTLADYLPQYTNRIAFSDVITLRMMFQHRSGIPNYIDDADFTWSRSLTADEYLELVLDEPADFEPNSDYAYSNTNFLLISYIMDSVLGYDHQKYIKEQILTPLNLTNTYATLYDADAELVSSGYTLEYPLDIKQLNAASSSGSMISTAKETGIFLRALNDGSLLGSEAQQIYQSIYTFEHTGLWPGYSSIARYHPDIDAVVIMFVNTSGNNSWFTIEIIYSRIVKILRKQHDQ